MTRMQTKPPPEQPVDFTGCSLFATRVGSPVMPPPESLLPPDNAVAETIELAVVDQPRSSGGARVALVESPDDVHSDAGLLALRQRLRTICLILFVGFTVFFIRQVVAEGVATAMRWNWAMVYAALVSSMVLLTVPRASARAVLRLCEILIFGGTTWFFAATIHLGICNNLRPSEVHWAVFNVTAGTTWFCVLAFIYALMMAASWQHVAVAVSVFAGAPAGVLLYDRLHYPAFAAAVNANMTVSILLMLATCGGGVVYWSYRFGQLQREAALAKRFGQYQLKRLLGRGGMGEVYLAEHVLLKRPCAIKRIRPGHDADPMTLARFEREVRATAELSHPHTVEIYDYGRAGDGTFYYVMEYLWGLTLEELVNRYGPLPASRAVYLLGQVCDALHEAHVAGLIHRDIKPGNIFAARRGGEFDFVKLLDFGLVKGTAIAESPNLSRAETVIGSPLFMAPEQATSSGDADARADIYSLGAVGYFLVAGRPPFTAATSFDILIAHARDPVAPPSQFVAGVPCDLEEILLRCLAKNPDERFPSAAALGQALANVSVAGDWARAEAHRWWQEHAGDERPGLAG